MFLGLLVLGWSAQAQTPELEIAPSGGGLGRAAILLAGRTGVLVTWENVPRVEGIAYRYEERPDGGRSLQFLYPDLRVRYPATATSRQIAEAMVVAYNALDADGRYRVLESDRALHLIPTEARTADGRYEPVTPLLDTVLTLDRVTGEPTHLYREILAELVETSGVPVQDSWEWLVGDPLPVSDFERNQADVTLPRATGTARELFTDLLRVSSGPESGWMLNWSIGAGWSFSFTAARPEDETRFNRTPLIPAEVPVTPVNGGKR